VRIVDRFADLQKEPQPRRHFKSMFIAIPVDGFSVNVFGHQIRIAGRGNAALQQPGNVVMCEGRQQSTLHLKSFEKFRVYQVGSHHLQRDRLIELSVHALRAIDHAHTAAPQYIDGAIQRRIWQWEYQLWGSLLSWITRPRALAEGKQPPATMRYPAGNDRRPTGPGPHPAVAPTPRERGSRSVPVESWRLPNDNSHGCGSTLPNWWREL
jgi:hypothetical protein